MKRVFFFTLLLAVLAATPFDVAAQKGRKAKKTTKAVSTKRTPATSLVQGKAWATYSNGVLTFSYGAKPQPPAKIECSGCGQIMSFTLNYCSNCGAQNKKDFVVYDAFERIPYPYYKEHSCGPWIEKSEVTKKVVFSSSFKQVNNLTDISYWFCYMFNLTEIIGLEYLNTAKVTNMRDLFEGCSKLKSIDLSHFDTSNVTNMSFMFNGCKSLTRLDVSRFKTDKVTNMRRMFCAIGCKSIDVSHFNTANVTDMEGMFTGSLLTTLDLSNFDTSKVTNMYWMFEGCTSLISVNVSSFNTSNVKHMERMFAECESLTTLDLTSFDTRNAIANHMFEDSWKLKTIYVTDAIWQPKVDTSKYHPYVMESCNAKIIKK